jgi:hypothetical protein
MQLFIDLLEAAIESSKDSESKYKYLTSCNYDQMMSEIKIENVLEEIQNI